MEYIGDGLIDLRPCERLVIHNLECFADGVRIAQQTDEPMGEIFIPGHRPQ